MNTTKRVREDLIRSFRALSDRNLETKNYGAAVEISGFRAVNPRYDPRVAAGPANPQYISGWDALHYWGTNLANEMTNRIHLNKEVVPEYKRFICDARLLTHDKSAGYAAFVPLVEWYQPAVVYIQYNRTTRGADVNYFFNLMLLNAHSGKMQQIAHVSIHSNTRGGAGSNIGNFHLKDETVFPPPAAANVPFRRYLIGFVKQAGALKRLEFILQKQGIQPISQMAITFSKVVFEVLQEFFDAGFTAGGMGTPYEDCSVRDPATGVYGIPAPVIVAPPAVLPRVAGGKRKTRRMRKNRS